MNTQKFIVILITISISVLISACGAKTTQAPPTISSDVLETQAAQTIEAGVTPIVIIDTSTPVPPTKTPRHTNTPLPSVTPAPTRKPTSSFFSGEMTTYRDDFESLTGWFTISKDNYEIKFSEGGYRMRVNVVTGDWPVYSVREPDFKDISTSVDIIREQGPDNSYFGVVCRFTDVKNYYRFVLYTDGYYEIGKMVDGKFTVLETDKEANVLLPTKTNNIRGDCVGSILTLYVNNKKIKETLDSELMDGYVGMIAGTNEKEGLEVLFDNFVVTEP